MAWPLRRLKPNMVDSQCVRLGPERIQWETHGEEKDHSPTPTTTVTGTSLLLRGAKNGIISAQGIQRLRRELPARLAAETVPVLGRDVVEELRERLLEWDRRITDSDHRIEHLAKQNDATRRLMQVEGVGPITATAVLATIGEGHYKNSSE